MKNSCHGCGNELKPWEGQKPFDDISGGKQSHRSKNSRRSRKSHLSSNNRRRESDVGDTPSRQNSKFDTPNHLKASKVDSKDNPKRQLSKESKDKRRTS